MHRFSGCGLILLCLSIFTGCHASHPVDKGVQADPLVISVAAPADLQGGIDAEWAVSWIGGEAPFSVNWDFGGGADPDSVAAPVEQRAHAATVNMLNDSVAEPAGYFATCSVQDNTGQSAAKTVSYTVKERANQRPVIESAVFDAEARTLQISASDPDAEAQLTASVTVPAGLAVEGSEKQLSQTGPLSASFLWSAAEEEAGGSGETTVTVKDQYGGKADAAVWVYVPRYGAAANVVTIKVPDNMSGGETADWLASWTGEAGSYAVAWDFGGGAEPNSCVNAVEGQFISTTVEMLNSSHTEAAEYTMRVTVTDADGIPATASAAYTVGPVGNEPPHIDSAIYTLETRILRVVASDPDASQRLAISIAPPAALVVDRDRAVATQPGQFAAEFNWEAADVFTGGSGEAEVVASDLHGGKARALKLIEVPKLDLMADTLYAVPVKHKARVGDVVQVVLATGLPDNPFQYLACASVTMPDWAYYAQNSFNIGAAGGAPDEADGLWAADGMDFDGFLIAPDGFYYAREIADLELDGRHRLEVVALPISSTELPAAEGPVCNFGVLLTQTGTASFGFAATTGACDRTYYRDFANKAYYWGTLMAGPDGTLNVTGVDNTIVVTE